jgi:Ca-activated chloride channel family protein
MQFLWPGFLLLLLLVPLLIGLYVLGRRRRRPDAVRYSSLSLIRDALPGSSFIRRHLPFALFAVALAGLAVAVARPVVIASVPTNEATIVLAIDVSGSMCSTDVAPSRIEAAEAAAANFIGSQSSSTQIGIVAFSGFAEIVQPPTTDRNLLLDALHSLQTGRRTAVGSGILAAIDAIAEIDPNVAKSTSDTTPGVEPPPVPKGDYAPEIIVLLTDGSSNAGPLPTAAAQEAADRGLRVYTIGFGTADGGALSASCAPNLVGREPGGGQGGFGGGFGNQTTGSSPAGSTRRPSGRSPPTPAGRTTRPRAPSSSRASSRGCQRT